MKVVTSKYLSYCAGVKEAINNVLELQKKRNDKKLYMLGEIVHNPHVVNMLCKKGVKTVEDINEVPDDGILIIRAHGATKEVYQEARKRGLEIVDATCHIVLKNQKLVQQYEEDGYTVIMIGDKKHDEVVSIVSYAKHPIIISDKHEIHSYKKRLKKIVVILQTTEIVYNVKDILAELALYAYEIRFFNTICGPCRVKQEEAIHLAKNHDIIYIVGSKNSKNTENLYKLAREYNKNSYFIEDKSYIELNQYSNARSIAIISGTSTPDNIINEVVEYFKGK